MNALSQHGQSLALTVAPGGEKEPRPQKSDGGVFRRLWGTKDSEEKSEVIPVSKTSKMYIFFLNQVT